MQVKTILTIDVSIIVVAKGLEQLILSNSISLAKLIYDILNSVSRCSFGIGFWCSGLLGKLIFENKELVGPIVERIGAVSQLYIHNQHFRRNRTVHHILEIGINNQPAHFIVGVQEAGIYQDSRVALDATLRNILSRLTIPLENKVATLLTVLT